MPDLLLGEREALMAAAGQVLVEVEVVVLPVGGDLFLTDVGEAGLSLYAEAVETEKWG
jgi:hypothetical protein